MNFQDLTASKVLVARYLLEGQLTAPGSLSGHQADRLRLGLIGPPSDGARPNTAEMLRARLADLLLLCRDLNSLEETACRVRYGGSGAAWGTEVYRRVTRLCDLREGGGEDVASLKPKAPGGEPLGRGWAEVVGVRARRPSFEEVGAVCGCSPRQAARALGVARAKIGTAIKWRSFMQSQEAAS